MSLLKRKNLPEINLEILTDAGRGKFGYNDVLKEPTQFKIYMQSLKTAIKMVPGGTKSKKLKTIFEELSKIFECICESIEGVKPLDDYVFFTISDDDFDSIIKLLKSAGKTITLPGDNWNKTLRKQCLEGADFFKKFKLNINKLQDIGNLGKNAEGIGVAVRTYLYKYSEYIPEEIDENKIKNVLEDTKKLFNSLKKYNCGIYFNNPLIHGDFEKLCDEVNKRLEKGKIGKASMLVHDNFKVKDKVSTRLQETFNAVQRTLNTITIAVRKMSQEKKGHEKD